MKNGVDNVIK